MHRETVAPLQPEGSGVPLFLIAPGGEAISFVRSLGKEQPVFGVRVGRAAARSEIPEICQIAIQCADAIRAVRSRGPYALAGWCSAGLIALETARELERSGERAAFVALFDARTVFLPAMRWDRAAVVQVVRYAQRVAFFLHRVRVYGIAALRVALDARAGGLIGAGRRIVGEQGSSPVAKSLRIHRPEAWSGRVVHIWAAERPRGWFRDPEFLWGAISPQGFQFYEVPGDHHSMLKEPNAQRVAMILARELRQAKLAARHDCPVDGRS
jgi:thioesterase domain-containing protein